MNKIWIYSKTTNRTINVTHHGNVNITPKYPFKRENVWKSKFNETKLPIYLLIPLGNQVISKAQVYETYGYTNTLHNTVIPHLMTCFTYTIKLVFCHHG